MMRLRDFLGILKPGDTFIKIDIHDGFYHLPVSPSSQHYLGCRDGTCLCSLKTAPIGFTLSPWWFTWTMLCALTHIRQVGRERHYRRYLAHPCDCVAR